MKRLLHHQRLIIDGLREQLRDISTAVERGDAITEGVVDLLARVTDQMDVWDAENATLIDSIEDQFTDHDPVDVAYFMTHGSPTQQEWGKELLVQQDIKLIQKEII